MENRLKWCSVLLVALVLATSAIACSSGAPSTQAPASTTSCEISWSEAKSHYGDRCTVCGPVVSATYASSSRGQPTFLNIGKPYPDPARFTVVIWGEDKSSFSSAPESYYRGKSICVTGLIVEYSGAAEIEVTTPSQIQVQ